jgi:transcriptional regulator with PAS, ATPase and Fis domain
MKPETQQEYEKRIAEQNALYDVFDQLWPHDIDPVKRDLNDELGSLERVLVQDAMREAKHNKTKAAELLSISRENLIYKLKKLDID